jgi:hypothetical protein
MICVCGSPVVDLTASESMTSSWYNSSSVISRGLSTNSSGTLHQVQKNSNKHNNIQYKYTTTVKLETNSHVNTTLYYRKTTTITCLAQIKPISSCIQSCIEKKWINCCQSEISIVWFIHCVLMCYSLINIRMDSIYLDMQLHEYLWCLISHDNCMILSWLSPS